MMWEQMWRASIHYSHKGLGVHAISAVDIALWDLFGKTLGEPVYNLMGGRTKQRVPVYATGSRPDLAQEMGFNGAKIPLPYGPADGAVGMRQNVAFISDWREKVGPDFPLMLDCYMALDWQYAAELAQRLAPFNLKWIEEALMPDEYAAHAKLAAKLRTEKERPLNIIFASHTFSAQLPCQLQREFLFEFFSELEDFLALEEGSELLSLLTEFLF